MVFLLKGKNGRQTHIVFRICGMSFALLLLKSLRDCHTFLNLMVTVSVQRGWNAVQVAAYCGHLSLVKELVDSYHGTVHQKAEVITSQSLMYVRMLH